MSKETSMVKRDNTEPEHIGRNPVVRPLVDIYENDEEVLLIADIPGVKKEDLEIQLDKDVLTLAGRRQLHDVPEAAQQEIGSVDYRREFRVGNGIDAGAISAQLSDGVLQLHLPKAEGLKPKKIAVTAG